MRLWYSFKKEVVLSFKSFYIYIEIGMALIFVAIMLFVVPENFTSDMIVYANIDIEGVPDGFANNFFKEEESDVTFYDTKEEVKIALKENRSAIGVYITANEATSEIIFTYILQGYEDQKMRNILEASIKNAIIQAVPTLGESKEIKVKTLGENTEKLTDRVNLVPIFLVLNSSLMGLFIIAAYIFIDKEEGTIKAFAVSPAYIWEYLLGKMGLMLFAGILTGILTVLLVAGFKWYYVHALVLLIVANGFGSALGLFISSFFDTMTKAMGWLFVVIILNGFASIAYFMPSFHPLWIQMLPSYPLLFAFRETLLENGDLIYVYTVAGIFLCSTILLFLLSNYRYKKTLTV